MTGHRRALLACAVSPDGEVMASSSVDGAVKVWNIDSCICFNTMKGHNRRVRACAFTPDSLNIVSGSSDGTLKL